ncbi:MAG TPA: sigma-70 family RNA polymerase sigma factor [Gemmataceae bacterium]|jgi:RNA polymerase sigma factor (sigma-70 family)|nr:sigma-70 family RNA polymerase sigma factor [Gemmataceae bacterium]
MMAKAALSSVIRRLVSAQALRGLTDRHLLERFIAHKDEAAFAALAERHGAMVLAVAANVLHHPQDAEDVFQATFLVLARQAGSVRKRGSVGSWLHGVAYRLALKARTAAATRHRHESSTPVRAAVESADNLTWRELSGILHEELDCLPDKYRAPLVLCYLEGMTQDQAAEHLGLPKGTLKGRLERARLLLRGRLVRRGLAPAVVLLADTHHPVCAAVPGLLASTTARAAAAFAAGRPAGVSAQVACMTQGVLKTMFATKLRFVAALLLAIGLVAGATGVLASRGSSGGSPATEETPEKPRGEQRKEPPWGEAVGGWRMRVTTAAGTEYRRNTPLPLSLELQNDSGGPLALGLLASSADPEVTDGAGRRLVARPLIDVSAWEGRRDHLPAGASLKWTVDFDRMRFSTQPLKAGTALRVRFRLAMRSVTLKGAPDEGRQRLVASNQVSLKLRDEHPSLLAGEAGLPTKWAGSMMLVYREHRGLLGYDALRIDGEGRAALVTVGNTEGMAGPAGPIRTEAALKREHLDRLATFLRDQKLWELAGLSQAKLAAPDEGEIRFSAGMGHGSLVASFPDSTVRGQPKLEALKAVLKEVMAVVRGKSASTAPVDQAVWGTPLKGLRVGLCRTEAKGNGKARLMVVLENVGTDDLVVNLGLMLANGKKQIPMAARLIFTDADGQRHILRRNEPGIAGRVDPFVVPLAAGSRYSTISRDLEKSIDRLTPGRYRVRAEFVGEAVTRKEVDVDAAGLALMTYWTGTIQSEDLQVTLPAKPDK